MSDEALNFEQVMERLTLSRADVYRLVKDGKLKGETLEGGLQFSEVDVETFEKTRDEEKTTLTEALEFWLNFYEQRRSEALDEAKGNLGKPEIIVETGGMSEESEAPEESGKEPSVEDRIKKLAQKMVTDGMVFGASDIYLDPLQTGDRVLYRSDGRLHDMGIMNGALSEMVKAQLRDLGKLVAQEDDNDLMEGIFTQTWQEQVYQVRMVTAPTVLGEHIHLHFYEEEQTPDLVVLGYSTSQAEAMRQLLTGQPGVLIAAGAADPQADRHRLALANTLAAEGRLVVSLEHRLHYRSESLVQLEMSDRGAFERVIKTVLRMRPDVVMFDEVKEKEEVDALIETALSGAMVVAQVRAAGVVEAILDWVDLGVTKEGLARVLLGGVERRALRQLCVHCRMSRETSADERVLLNGEDTTVFAPVGCDVCGDGFLGWTRRFGVWPVDADFLQAVRKIERPGVSLIEWGNQNALGLPAAVKAAAINGEVAFDDILTLIDFARENGR